MIGGWDADDLRGQRNGDIIIGGLTTYDNDLNSLQNILNIWTTGSMATERANDIQNGATPLLPGQLIDDAAVDKLMGNSGDDWFFQAVDDILRDHAEILDLL